MRLSARHEVLTPEYVAFHFELAGPVSRALAWALDGLVVVATAGLTVVLVAPLLPPGFATAFGFVSYFLLEWGYGVALETAWSGQTLGKRALGLRVIQASGVRLTFPQALLRNLVRPVDRLPLLYGVGAVVALLSSRRQRLGDLLAGTVVVVERRRALPASLFAPQAELSALDSPAFRAQVARLSNEEAAVLVSAALRRDELGLPARVRLFADLAARLHQELGLVKPPHLSDEKLCLLVASQWLQRRGQRGAAGLLTGWKGPSLSGAP